MNITAYQYMSIALIAATFVMCMLYLAWNMLIKKRRLNRVAEGDRKLYQKDKRGYRSSLVNVFSVTPQVISEVAGVTVACLVLVITLLMRMEPNTFEAMITSTVLVSLGISSISYLMSMEQLTVAMSPSITEGEKFRLYKEAVDLKLVGFVTLWGSILLAMVLTHIYAVMIACIMTLVIVYRHYSRRWMEPGNEI